MSSSLSAHTQKKSEPRMLKLCARPLTVTSGERGLGGSPDPRLKTWTIVGTEGEKNLPV